MDEKGERKRTRLAANHHQLLHYTLEVFFTKCFAQFRLMLMPQLLNIN